MDKDAWIETVTREIDEVVTEEELESLYGRGDLRAYVGIEPSGLLHIGQGFLISNKIKDLMEAGFHVTVLLADWHAYINDKWGGDMEKIRTSGAFLEDAFRALGCTGDGVEYVYASSIIDDADYWEKVLRISKSCTVNRIRRALTIMGRQESDAETDASKLIYPAMQAADIFHLNIDLAYGGMDQRKAHMLARDSADKLGWKKFAAIHSPLMAGLKGGAKMDLSNKMSKSDPDSAIFVHDREDDIRRKVKKAWCDEGAIEGNPILDIAKFIIFRNRDELHIQRPEKWGGDMHFNSYEELESAFQKKELHPADLKKAVADALVEILKPVREELVASPNFKKVRKMVKKR